MKWLDKAIRKAGGYRKVAEITGITEPHLRNAGSGRRGIGPDAVEKLQAAFPTIPARLWLEALKYQPPRPARAEPSPATDAA